MRLPFIGGSRREADAEQWAVRAFPGSVPRCAARVSLILVDCLNCDFENLAVESAFTESGEFTELDQVQLLLALEREFIFSIPDEDAATLITPAAIVSYFERRESSNVEV